MALVPGTRLGPYEILSPLGAGGMGEVYRGRDTKLDRKVAIKILPDTLMHDPERLARFEREAKVLASLNHPNIAQIYAVEQGGLVMELVAGETLRGPLPIETALNYTKQIAEALEAAHEKGIIHRDLKPANIMVTSEGVVKVLDFGLAKAAEESTGANDAANSPTLTMSPTRAGMILGTAAYMAPEQARGQSVDRRADIWAFGCVLYELISGKPAFPGESVADILSAVLKTDPDLSVVPAPVRKLIARCLTKDRKHRLQAIGDGRILIEELLGGAPQEIEINREAHNLVPWVVAAAALLASVLLAVGWWRGTRLVEHPIMRLSVDLGPDALKVPYSAPAISPDGTRLVFPVRTSDGKQILAMRLLSETKSTLLSGTENGSFPFFSPNSSWIGFFADGKMKKISTQGGLPLVLGDAPNPRGADWGVQDDIVLSPNFSGAVSLVSAEGGAREPIDSLQGGTLTHRWPQRLTGSETILFTLSSSTNSFEDASIAALPLRTGKIKILVRGGYFGRYLPTSNSSGHLVYVHEGVLYGVPFDPARLELRGAATPLLEDLASDPTSGVAEFSFSRAGNFVYQTGRRSVLNWRVSWLDRSGNTKPLISALGSYASPRFSPDGKRLALVRVEGNNRRVFVYDLKRDTISRLSFDAEQTASPIWSPDSQHIVFSFRSADGFGLGWMRGDGSGEPTRLLDSKNSVNPNSFLPDGRRLVYSEVDPSSGDNLGWTSVLDISDPEHPKLGKPEPLLRPYSEFNPTVSPDGHWIAYASIESGRAEVYVRPFQAPGGKWQVSSDGGGKPVWSRNGMELFFENPSNRIMVTEYQGKNESFTFGKPQVWSDQQLQDVGGAVMNYDLAPDGKRFAILPELKAPVEEKDSVHMIFLENFFDELRRRVPVSN